MFDPFWFCLLHVFSGVDPLVFAVLCGISSGVVGFILGGATFNVIWKFIFRHKAQEMHKVIACSYTSFYCPGTSEIIIIWVISRRWVAHSISYLYMYEQSLQEMLS